MTPHSRKPLDLDAYNRAAQTNPCFICGIVNHGPGREQHHILYEDADHIGFLNRFPTLIGYALVAPRIHRINVTGDFTAAEYVATQRVIHAIAEALRIELSAERIYILSLGSHQGNAHVHWHIAPLPPHTPYEQQQFEALRAENGILDLSDNEMEALATRLRTRLASAPIDRSI